MRAKTKRGEKKKPSPIKPYTPLDTAVKKALFDPDWFCSQILRYGNAPWQSELMNAIADLDRARAGKKTLFNHDLKTRFTIRGPNGSWKTSFMGKLAHWWQFTRVGLVPCTAPKEKQLKTRLWGELRKCSRLAIPGYSKLIEIDALTATWGKDPDWAALAETAREPENLAGHHNKWLCYLVDEASGMRDEMMEAVEGCITDDTNIMVMIGNTTRPEGEFYRSHVKKGTENLYYSKHVTFEDAYWISRTWANGLIQKYGEKSPVVQIRVYANFAETAEDQLIPLSWVEDAKDRGENSDGLGDGSLSRLRVTADIADGGEDETVVAVFRMFDTKTILLELRRYSFPPGEAPLDSGMKAVETFERWGGDVNQGDDFVVDALGVGAGTVGYIIKQGLPVVEYKGGAKSDDITQWRNRRVQSYMVYRNALRDKTFEIAPGAVLEDDWEDFIAQNTSIKSKPGMERVEDLKTKEEMKRMGIKSPDMVDACAMAFATQKPTHRAPDTRILVTPAISANFPEI